LDVGHHNLGDGAASTRNCGDAGPGFAGVGRVILRFASNGGSSEDSTVLDTMAHIYVRQGRYREAQTALNNAEALAPPYDRTLHQRLTQLQ
jgi:hypothetical protein